MSIKELLKFPKNSPMSLIRAMMLNEEKQNASNTYVLLSRTSVVDLSDIFRKTPSLQRLLPSAPSDFRPYEKVRMPRLFD